MAKKDIHTVRQHADGRANRAAGNDRVSNTARTKAADRDMAIDRGVEHFIHNRDDTIAERNSYPRSRDPRRSGG